MSDLVSNRGWGSRDCWEGDRLGVDTNGFLAKKSRRRLRLVERFKRDDVDTIIHEVAVTDPMVFTRSWTVPFLLTKPNEGLLRVRMSRGN